MDLIRAALTDAASFRKAIATKGRVSNRNWKKAEHELAELRRADIVILNEVDFGMKRTGYADVARVLAEATGMNYAFGVEFVEVDRLYTGEERIQMDTPELSKALEDDLRVDPGRYLGMHGNAILSRFPIRSAAIERLSECYDWYGEETRRIAALEKRKRWAAKKIFSERIRRQVRRGGRSSLMIELEVEGAPERFTVVSTHLEDRTTSSCRRKQLAEVRRQVRDIPGVVVIGADLNTSGTDGTPTSLRYEVMKRVSDHRFWIGRGIQWFSPLAVPAWIAWPVNFLKNHHDPTAIHIPIVAPNRARKMFEELREFRFADGGRFELEGDRTRSGNGRSGTLANSNQRSWKGFQPTFRMERTYTRLVGTYRLDWLLVKAAPSAEDREMFRPRNPNTLRYINEVGDKRLSDHHPIGLELELSVKKHKL